MKFLVAFVAALTMGFVGSASGQTTVATDDASNYGGENPAWASGANGGSGFGAWVLTANQGEGHFAGSLIGNPGDAGLSEMPNPSFALYANPNIVGNYSGAARPFSEPLNVGEIFSITLGFNFDSGNSDGTKGLKLFTGGAEGTAVIEIIMGNTATININGETLFTEYGSTPMNFTIKYVSAGNVRVYAFGRTGTEIFNKVFAILGAPDAFEVFAQRLNSDDQRQPYFNNMKVEIPAETTIAAINLTSPSVDEAAVGVTTSLTWASDAAATSYRVEISRDAEFSEIVTSTELTGTTFTPSASLRMQTTYFWRVRGANANADGDWSVSRSFTTAVPTLSLDGNKNGGFGGTIGTSKLLFYHDDNFLYGEFIQGSGTFGDTDALVLYFNTGAEGRTVIDGAVNDQGDALRRAISSTGIASETPNYGSVIRFPAGFEASFGIAIDRSFGGMWSIPATGAVGNNELPFVSSVNSTLTTASQQFATFRVSKANLSFDEEDAFAFDIVATYLNKNNGFTSNEGYTLGFGSDNPGAADVNLRSFWSYPSGEATAELVFAGQAGWRFLSSPFQNKTYGDLLAGRFTQGFTGSNSPEFGTSNVLRFDGSAVNYVSIDNLATTLAAGQGFAAGIFQNDAIGVEGFFPKVTVVSGAPHTGSISPTLNAFEQFTLVGNPYLSAIDFDNITKTGISDVIYVYDYVNVAELVGEDAANMVGDEQVGTFRSWNGEAGGLGSGRIAPFQAFLVYRTDEVATFTIEETNKSGSTIFRGKETAPAKTIELQLFGNGTYSAATVHFSEQADAGFDSKDAVKMYPFAADFAHIQTVSSDDVVLELNHHPYPGILTEIPVQMYVTQPGTYYVRVNIDNVPQDWSAELRSADGEFVWEIDATGHTAMELTSGGFHNFVLILSDGSATTAGVDNNLPARITLHQNYPNPFNPVTNIRFELPVSSDVRLEIFDVTGRKIATLSDGNYASGAHTVLFDATNIGSGVFMYRLQAGGEVMIGKMTLIK